MRGRFVKGYKGMDKDMQCLGYQFEIGKKYRINGKVKLCKNGFHFCEKLVDVFKYYEKCELHKFFEIEASGTVKSDGEKSAAREITIIRELGEAEINRAFYGNGNCYNGYNGYGGGYEYGYDYGNGNGYGNGFGYGYGNGYSYGYGYNNGDGNGYGNGNGCGDGCGCGKGDGKGFGDGKNIQKILIFN